MFTLLVYRYYNGTHIRVLTLLIISLSISLCAGVQNYCPDGVHLVVGDVPTVSFGAHSPGEAELLVSQHLLSQLICALKVHAD